MSTSDDLIDFDIIEGQKENIQSLPGGRSARALANLFSPTPSHKLSTPTPSDTKNIHDEVRQEFEDELSTISESDDPLDIFDRYVKWTLDAYPSAQSTPQSQLLALLERATKAFLTSTQYKNDPRYLKLWLSYIRFFSDSPRETFAFLARHNIGDGLALFYEEFAAWLEGAGRWKQAEEIYNLGIEREARPAPRLIRKFNEFKQRYEQQSQDDDAPASPALPTVRPALAAKLDPYASVSRDPQAPRQGSGAITASSSRAGRQKLAIFSDADDASPPAIMGESGSQAWESIGTIAERKKENTISPKPWAGETLKAGGKKSTAPKMAIFKDESIAHIKNPLREQATVNPRTGKSEVVFVNLEAVYPNPEVSSTEMSFEELRALHRGWLYKDWVREKRQLKSQKEESEEAERPMMPDTHVAHNTTEKFVIARDPILDDQKMVPKLQIARDSDLNEVHIQEKLKVLPFLDENGLVKDAAREGKSRKFKVQEINQTQIIKTKFSSPSGKKPRRKGSGSNEPTMTIHTRAATDEIYDIFSAPLNVPAAAEDESNESEEDEGDETDADYTSGAESTGTQRLGPASDMGDETSDVRSISEWSDFTARKHIPNIDDDSYVDAPAEESEHGHDEIDDRTENYRISREDQDGEEDGEDVQSEYNNDEVVTPVSPQAYHSPSSEPAIFVPVQQEDFAPTRPYRDAAQIANNRLPFMTPIAEKTESSLGAHTARGEKDYFSSKTPSKANGVTQKSGRGELLSSPFQEIVNDSTAPSKLSQPALGYKVTKTTKAVKSNKTAATISAKVLPSAGYLSKDISLKGPIINDAQCNPMDDFLRNLIFASLQPPLNSYDGFYEHLDEMMGKGPEIRKFTKAVAKISKNSGDKNNTNISSPPILHFPGLDRQYKVKKELGNGAYAPVYLVETVKKDEEGSECDAPVAIMGRGHFDLLNRKPLEALKMEDPPSAWEFYIMRQVKRRLGLSRPAESLITAYEMHLYQDECYLIEEFRGQGTLHDLVNLARAEAPVGGVMDESLVMFFSIELFRTVEALHAKGILHGDLKADNCLIRFDPVADDKVWSLRYRRDGTGGWSQKGLVLIDFGRGIDMKLFRPDVQFIADWETSPQDCAEMRDLRPWTYQIDYHGLAGIIYHMLFGKYIETIADGAAKLGAGAHKSHRIKESFKRYWQQDIWSSAFDVLLNPLMHVEHEEGTKMPVLKGMKRVREEMENWLETNCEKGVGLQATIRRLEHALQAKRR